MIVADSSILIAASRPSGIALQKRIDALAVVTAGVVQSEMLKGARDPLHRTKIVSYCDGYELLEFRPEHWIALGDNLAALRRKGICVPLGDVILATLAIAYDMEVWARDKHFPLMQTVLPELKLFTEPA